MPPTANLIDRLEYFFKTDLRYLIRGGFWASAGQVLVTLSSLALSLIAARYVPQEVYGEYKYVVAAVALISSFSLTGLASAVFQSTASGYDAALPDGFRINLRWSLGIFAATIATGGYYLVVGNIAIGLGILLGGCITPFLASANLYASYLNGKKNFKLAAIYADVVGTVLPFGSLCAVAFLYPRPLALIATYFITNTAAVFYAYWQTIRRYQPSLGHSDPGMLSYAKHLSIMGIFGGIAGNIDQVLLFHYTSAAILAIYTFATGILDQTKGPLKSLDSMMQARFAKRTDKDIQTGMRQKQFWLLLASLALIAIYIPLAPLIYHVLFPAYSAAVPYSQVYALSMLGLVLAPIGSHMAAKKKLRAQYASSIANSVLQMVVIAAGVIWWGLWGLIIARVITRLFGGVVTYFVYRLTPLETV